MNRENASDTAESQKDPSKDAMETKAGGKEESKSTELSDEQMAGIAAGVAASNPPPMDPSPDQP
jgi:hypothetical protein